MASFSAETLNLAGFTLAHAAWNVSDLSIDDLLAPLALVEERGERRLIRFEADTQEEAIVSGKAAMEEATHSAEGWAFAREGLWRPGGKDAPPQDVLTLDFWGIPMKAPASILLPFRRMSEHMPFQLLSEPVFVVDGRMMKTEDSRTLVAALDDGIQSHGAVAPYGRAGRRPNEIDRTQRKRAGAGNRWISIPEKARRGS